MKQVCNSELSVVNVNRDETEEEGRVFSYSLNKKKAKAKLLKGAKRMNSLEVEVKDGCVNLRFCDGSFYEIVLPLVKLWSQKVNETVQINGTEVKIAEVHAGLEKSDNHVDTKLIVFANGDRLVLHAYNGTQNLMVQGKNYENFAKNCLQPFFVQNIEKSLNKIKQFNNDVKQTLGSKNVNKIKSDNKPYNCQYCEVKPATIGDLRLHMKKCHTKPAISSPNKNKALKFVSDANTPVKAMEKEVDSKSTNVVGKVVLDVVDLVCCEKCEFDAEDQYELDKHMESVHGQNIQPITTDNGQVRSIENPVFNVEESDEMKVDMKENTAICGECGKGFENELQCTLHMTSHELTLDSKCEICNFTTRDESELKTHIQSIHKIVKVDLNDEDQNVIKCNKCEYKCKLNIQYKKHMNLKHKQDKRYSCKHCEFSTNFIGSVWEHTLSEHEDEESTAFTPKESKNFILNMVAEQTTSITEELEIMKKDTKDVHNNLADILTTLIGKIVKIEKA